MNTKWFAAAGLMIVFVGCRTMPDNFATANYRVARHWNQAEHREATIGAPAKSDESEIRQTSFQDSSSLDRVEVASQNDSSNYQQEAVNSSSSVVNDETTLVELEQMALAVNPAVQQVQAEIESLRGKLIQAGLPPNPTVGVAGEDINEDGGSGKYGIFFGREIVRGNKLRLSRSVVWSEIQAAKQRLGIIQEKALTDVRRRYYELLVAQEKVFVATELVGVVQKSVDSSKMLFEARESARTAVLQSELELENAKVTQRQAENERLAARRKLAGLLGEDSLPVEQVAGNVRDIIDLEEFEQSFDILVNNSPEIAALLAEVEQSRRRLARECVEAVPNITWQTNLLYDTVGDDVVTVFQVGMPIPTTNRNQGGIYQARQQITVAQQNADKRVLDLRQRLASAYETYFDAKLQVDAFSSEILPKAKETFDIVSQGYAEGEIDYLQLLTAQRTYSQTKLQFLDSLRRLWQQNVNIRGLLLNGSLE